MRQVLVPTGAMARAIEHMGVDVGVERGGWIVMDERGHVLWMPMDNVHDQPELHTRFAAESMAVMIGDLHLKPIAIVHSHPSGMVVPSPGDLDDFPWVYVCAGIIWTPQRPDMVCVYNCIGEGPVCLLDEVVVNVGH